jgi:hypothetical protein
MDIIQRWQRKRNNNATTHRKAGTILSPKHGVIPKGHCQPGTDPIPRTSEAVKCRAMEN